MDNRRISLVVVSSRLGKYMIKSAFILFSLHILRKLNENISNMGGGTCRRLRISTDLRPILILLVFALILRALRRFIRFFTPLFGLFQTHLVIGGGVMVVSLAFLFRVFVAKRVLAGQHTMEILI